MALRNFITKTADNFLEPLFILTIKVEKVFMSPKITGMGEMCTIETLEI